MAEPVRLSGRARRVLRRRQPGVYPGCGRYGSDTMIHVTEDRCGPDYQRQTEPQPCDLFVHDFPNGLPPTATTPGPRGLWDESEPLS